MHSGTTGTDPPAAGGALPWPPEWPGRASRWQALNLVFLSLLALGLAGLAAAAASTGDRVTAVVFAGSAGLLGLVVAGVAPLLRVRRRPAAGAVTVHTVHGERGVRFRYSTWWYGWLVALVAAAGTGYGAVALAVLLGADGPSSGQAGRMAGLAVVGVVAVPYCGWFLVDAARGRVARGRLVLTPRGVHHRGLVHDEFVPWDGVLAVAAGRGRGPLILLPVNAGARRWWARSAVGLRRRPGRPEVLEVPGRLLGTDPALLYHALGFYLTRPAARAELGTDAGLRRILAGDLASG